MPIPYKSAVLVILDGWGVAPPWGGNAISSAKAPTISSLWRQPTVKLDAHGAAVGLTGHERGNSEVGHLNLGAGRIVLQDATRISRSVENKSFKQNGIFTQALNLAKQRGARLHLMGLLTTANVHADIKHVHALLEMVKENNIKECLLHIFTDGRDNDPRDGLVQVVNLEQKLTELGIGRIQTICGRYYAMDRDHRWERTEKIFHLIAHGQGIKASSARVAVSKSYSEGVTDEFLAPVVVDGDGISPYQGIKSGDVVIFWNFRADRARQLTRAFTEPKFNAFSRGPLPLINFISMTPYGAERELTGVISAFRPEQITNTIAEVISKAGGKQFHLAETEKYAHVTYFFNGGREEPFIGEDRKLIPSPKVATYDLKPEMNAAEITRQIINAVNSDNYKFIVANYANPDMLGHTGNFQGAIKAVEVINGELTEIIKVCASKQIPLLITADHGNVEEMVNPQTGDPDTEHTTNLVPFHIILPDKIELKRDQGILADVAPTLLFLLGIPQPPEMTGKNLLKTDIIEQGVK